MSEPLSGPVAEPPVPLAGTLTRAFSRFASRPALRDADTELSFAELGQRARRLARAFRALGAEPGARLVILGPNSCQWAQAEKAMAIGGYARVALLPRLHASELARIVADIEPALVLVDGGWLADHGRDWISAAVKDVIVLGGEPAPGLIPFAELAAAGSDDELPAPAPDSIAWVLYTSGSTGLPKGVLVTQRNVGALVRNAQHEMPQIQASDVALHTAPISHFSGGISAVLTATGGLNILEPGFDAAHVADLAEAGEVTVLPLVPTMITMVLAELARRGQPTGRVGRVKLVPYAGSAIQPDRAALGRRYFGDAMQQVYGASEAQLPICSLHPGDHVDQPNQRGLPRLASAGRPTRYVRVEIVDANRQPLPPGQTGEIRTAGHHVSMGYWRQPEATAETFAGGWAYTGDVGYIDEHGYLFILDRRKDMIITGGFNVYPREVENAVSSLPGVREVAVVGAPDQRWGEVITAVVSTEPGTTVTADQVIAHCRASIGGYKVPKRVEFVPELPKNGTGKIDKPALREQLWAGQQRRV